MRPRKISDMFGNSTVIPGEAVELAEKLKVLVVKEEWELLDGILDAFVGTDAEDGTLLGAERGWWIGVHVGFLNKVAPQMRERRSFRDLIARYQTALDGSPIAACRGRKAEVVLGIAPLKPLVS